MSRARNLTYKCPNEKHSKTARRHKNENAPICPICGEVMIPFFIDKKKPKYQKIDNLNTMKVTICKYKY